MGGIQIGSSIWVPTPETQHLGPESQTFEIIETSEGILCHHRMWEGESIIRHCIFSRSLSQRVGPGPLHLSLRGPRLFFVSSSVIAGTEWCGAEECSAAAWGFACGVQVIGL